MIVLFGKYLNVGDRVSLVGGKETGTIIEVKLLILPCLYIVNWDGFGHYAHFETELELIEGERMEDKIMVIWDYRSELEQLCDFLHKEGFKWADEHSTLLYRDYMEYCIDWGKKLVYSGPTQHYKKMTFKEFKEKYMNKEELKFGDKVLCWDGGTCKEKQVFIAKVNDCFLACDEENFSKIKLSISANAKLLGDIFSYQYCEKIIEAPVKEVTLEDVANRFGVSVDRIRIKD